MKLYIGNLPFSVTENDLKELFGKFKPSEVTLITDKFSGRSKGFGFVTIDDDKKATEAIKEINGKDVQGREIRVSEARPREER